MILLAFCIIEALRRIRVWPGYGLTAVVSPEHHAKLGLEACSTGGHIDTYVTYIVGLVIICTSAVEEVRLAVMRRWSAGTIACLLFANLEPTSFNLKFIECPSIASALLSTVERLGMRLQSQILFARPGKRRQASRDEHGTRVSYQLSLRDRFTLTLASQLNFNLSSLYSARPRSTPAIPCHAHRALLPISPPSRTLPWTIINSQHLYTTNSQGQSSSSWNFTGPTRYAVVPRKRICQLPYRRPRSHDRFSLSWCGVTSVTENTALRR